VTARASWKPYGRVNDESLLGWTIPLKDEELLFFSFLSQIKQISTINRCKSIQQIGSLISDVLILLHLFERIFSAQQDSRGTTCTKHSYSTRSYDPLSSERERGREREIERWKKKDGRERKSMRCYFWALNLDINTSMAPFQGWMHYQKAGKDCSNIPDFKEHNITSFSLSAFHISQKKLFQLLFFSQIAF